MCFITEVTVSGAVVPDCIIFRGVSNILTTFVNREDKKIRNTSQYNAVQYNTIFNCDLNAKTYN